MSIPVKKTESTTNPAKENEKTVVNSFVYSIIQQQRAEILQYLDQINIYSLTDLARE